MPEAYPYNDNSTSREDLDRQFDNLPTNIEDMTPEQKEAFRDAAQNLSPEDKANELKGVDASTGSTKGKGPVGPISARLSRKG